MKPRLFKNSLIPNIYVVSLERIYSEKPQPGPLLKRALSSGNYSTAVVNVCGRAILSTIYTDKLRFHVMTPSHHIRCLDS